MEKGLLVNALDIQPVRDVARSSNVLSLIAMEGGGVASSSFVSGICSWSVARCEHEEHKRDPGLGQSACETPNRPASQGHLN